MRGELIGIWSETWREVWLPLSEVENAPRDLFCELYWTLANFLRKAPTVEDLADTIDDPDQARAAFEAITAEDLIGERAAVKFFEEAFSTLEDFSGDTLSNLYFNLVARLIEKFSLRYDLRRPFLLCPTLPGLFASLVSDLRRSASSNNHLAGLLRDFEAAVRDLKEDYSETRIKTCIQKHINMLEAVGAANPGVNNSELRGICDQINTWPHGAVKESLKRLYGFASDYPGIRHAGNPAGAKRQIEMRDLLAVSILLTGFVPYLHQEIDPDAIYRGR
jgi:hypothetical protein